MTRQIRQIRENRLWASVDEYPSLDPRYRIHDEIGG